MLKRPGWKFAASLDPQPPKKMHYPERRSISVSGQQPTYPSPNPTFTLTCWVRGRVGGQLPRYWYWSLKDIKIYGKRRRGNIFFLGLPWLVVVLNFYSKNLLKQRGLAICLQILKIICIGICALATKIQVWLFCNVHLKTSLIDFTHL